MGRDIVERRPAWRKGARNVKAAHARGVAILGCALLAAMMCGPAVAQSQPESRDNWFGGFSTLEEWRPALSSSDGRFTMSIRGRLQLDTGWFDQSQDVGAVTPERDVQFKDLRSGTMTRRAYLGVEGRAFGDFSYEYRMDFGETRSFLANPRINIARASYNAGDLENANESHFRIDAGLIRPILTFEDSTSSAALVFLERADVVNVATTGYGGGSPRLGFQLIFQTPDTFHIGDNLLISGALTGQNALLNNTAFPSNANFDGTKIFGRIAYRLPLNDFDGIQFGGSASQILSVGPNAAANGAHSVMLQDFPEIRVTGDPLISTGQIQARGGSLWGVEAAGNFRSLYMSGEYYGFGLDRAVTCAGCVDLDDPQFSGWYVMASWVLTGERKLYQPVATSSSFATFANPFIPAAFSLSTWNWGVWEVAARYSNLALNWHPGAPLTTCAGAFAGCVRGGEEKIWTFGVNWYLSNNVRMQVDYMMIGVDRLNDFGQQAGQALGAFGTRLQFTN